MSKTKQGVAKKTMLPILTFPLKALFCVTRSLLALAKKFKSGRGQYINSRDSFYDNVLQMSIESNVALPFIANE